MKISLPSIYKKKSFQYRKHMQKSDEKNQENILTPDKRKRIEDAIRSKNNTGQQHKLISLLQPHDEEEIHHEEEIRLSR